ncbi:hypothetical protein PVAP13_2KG127816 [Panicum virgatum]|uniref:Uncharacterized protein n=1 Tax=Panicum virgatum TaxID=38727 RepID=A0A8T0WDL7_PANVG|nr:hypothetical protein PVAP13_2KG127816 [Panicum virgatum]
MEGRLPPVQAPPPPSRKSALLPLLCQTPRRPLVPTAATPHRLDALPPLAPLRHRSGPRRVHRRRDTPPPLAPWPSAPPCVPALPATGLSLRCEPPVEETDCWCMFNRGGSLVLASEDELSPVVMPIWCVRRSTRGAAREHNGRRRRARPLALVHWRRVGALSSTAPVTTTTDSAATTATSTIASFTTTTCSSSNSWRPNSASCRWWLCGVVPLADCLSSVSSLDDWIIVNPPWFVLTVQRSSSLCSCCSCLWAIRVFGRVHEDREFAIDVLLGEFACSRRDGRSASTSLLALSGEQSD